MKYTGIFIFSILIFSCSKEKNHCYECDLTVASSGEYTDVGCMSPEEWDMQTLTDYYGNSLDKNTKCRIK